MRQIFLSILFFSLLATACTPLLGGDCPVSQFSDLAFVPPEPMPAEAPYEEMFWHGHAQLWTMLPKSGLWENLPLSEQGYGQKLFWWAPGYDVGEENAPLFSLVAKPLERLGEQYVFEQATNANSGELGSAILIGVNFPYAGCWELTGTYRGESLSYIVEIVP
jgi:hypothetical protein